MEEHVKERMKEMCLLMLYLTAWDEDSRKDPGTRQTRSWKNYPYPILNELEDKEMIFQPPKAKSAILTELGKRKAQQIKKRYL